jgi:hypothetical protein
MASKQKPDGQPSKRTFLDRFFAWYERHYVVNITFTAALFLLQLVHLYWLSADVVASRLVGQSYFELTPLWQFLIILVDYTEIPSLLSTTVLYLYQMRKGNVARNLLFLVFVNSQWLHLFWITDEFVINQFQGDHYTVLPLWLAWVAIFIDYLELPVIIDTIVKSVRAIRQGRLMEYWREAGSER